MEIILPTCLFNKYFVTSYVLSAVLHAVISNVTSTGKESLAPYTYIASTVS